MNDYQKAQNTIENGGCIVYPTETVYGIGADALDSTSVKKAYKAKKRDKSKPMSMAVPDVRTAKRYVDMSLIERTFIENFLPGPVTVLCKKKDIVPDVLTAGKDKVGIRIPDYDETLELLEYTGPITSTSANISGTASVTSVSDLSDEFLESVDYIFDDGELDGGTGSTVVDVEENKIHREGAVGEEVATWLEKIYE